MAYANSGTTQPPQIDISPVAIIQNSNKVKPAPAKVPAVVLVPAPAVVAVAAPPVSPAVVVPAPHVRSIPLAGDTIQQSEVRDDIISKLSSRVKETDQNLIAGKKQ